MKKLRLWAFTLLLAFPLFLPMRVATAQLKATLEGHMDHVWSVAFSPDGNTLASASWDQTVRLWNVETEQLLHTLTGHTDTVMSVTFSLDGQTLASGSWDGTIRLWNPHTGKLKRTLTDDMGGVGSVVFSPDGKMLANGSADQTIRLWNTTTWQVERILTGHTHMVDVVAFSPDGNTLASGSRDKTIRLWNPNTAKHTKILTGHTNDVLRMVFSPDGGTLASGSLDGTIRLWNPHTGKNTGTLPNQGGWVNPVAFSLDGGTLAIGGQGIRLWDTDTEEYKRPLIGDIGNAVSIVFSPDGQTIASGSADNLVRLLESTPPEVPFATTPFDVTNIPEPVPPPQAVRDFFDLAPFYQQWINVEGFPVLASVKVSPYAVREAAWLIYHISRHRPDLLQIMTQRRIRYSIIAYNEVPSDIPEIGALSAPHFFINVRNRVGNYTPARTVLGNEVSLLSRPIDSGLIHEMTHAFHEVLNTIDTEFDNRLKTTYDAAIEKGLWRDYYAATHWDECFAEGALSWFNATQFKAVNTREELKMYAPGLAMLLTEVFGDSDWRYTLPEMRTHLPHLQGFNPQSAPQQTEFPPGMLEAYEELLDPAIVDTAEWANLPPYHPSLIPMLNESTTGDSTSILFVNLSGAAVLVYWVRPDGTESYAYRSSADPNQMYEFTIGAGRLLLVKDLDGRNIAVFQAVGKVGRALVGPALNLITPGLSKISGDNQAGVSGAVLANPFIIEIRDENVSVLEGISVTFTVTAGGGTLSVTHTTTDENGRAESTLTLGPNLGTNAVSISAAGIAGSVTFTAVAGAAVDIPDQNLRAAVENALGKVPGATITVADMERLTHLEVPNANISDLTGLEHATNLTELYLGAEWVDAEGGWMNSNSASNLTPLAGLTHLTRLELRGNNITDISPLSGLTHLTFLSLFDNSISNISSLAGLTHLTELWLGVNNISDISPLSGLTNLTDLRLQQNNILDLSPLVGLTNLTRVALAHNSLSNISALAGLTHLATLGLGNNNISDISPLAGLTNLTRLGLRGNNIIDISPVVGLTKLTFLNLQHNNISDIPHLVANTGLGNGDEVYVRGNPLSYQSVRTHIPILRSRGVIVESDSQAHPALLKISGDNQKGASFAPLSQPFVVEAQDANGSALTGISVAFAVTAGGGTLSTTITRTDTNGRAQSTLTLGPNMGTNTVQISAAGIEVPVTFHAVSDTEAPPIKADVNNDGSVNVLDLILIASSFGRSGQNNADVNRDGVVSILDLILVAGMFEGAAAAPAAQPQVPKTLTTVEVQGWLTDARSLEVRDPIMKRGFMVLEQLLVFLTPRETELLANYPNPFNPETWIPYRLAEDAFVALTIYDGSGGVVRTLEIGHRIASAYESRSKAIYWDGKNGLGEQVASGVYFYTLTARDFSATRRMVILK